MENSNLSFEPMDIDLSSQSVKDMDISFNEPIEEKATSTRRCSRVSVSPPKDYLPCKDIVPAKQSVVKNYHIIIKRRRRQYKTLFKIVAAIIIVCISTITYYIHSLKCCDEFDLELIREELLNKLHGQSAAVELLIKTLRLEARSKIIFFSGGTGVGKSYTSSLLLDTIGTCSNVYHYTMPTFENTFSSDFMLGLTMCKTSRIFVDDLTANDKNVKVKIKNVIEKSQFLDKDITVILIYHCNQDLKGLYTKCDESFKRKLLSNFSEIKALKRFIQFKSLTKEHLKQCIKQELGTRQLHDYELEDLVKKFNVSVDGCKGVHSRIKYLNIG